MATEKVLITVKTYPNLSSKYEEIVCTAGLLEDGSWIRIYPVPLRKLDYKQQYQKYDWIEINLVERKDDFRPESYRPYSVDTPVKVVGHIDTSGNWRVRKEIVLQNVHYGFSGLIQQAKDEKIRTSLATYKPREILDFIAEETEREWDKANIEKLKALQAQGDLFEEHPKPSFEVVKKLPYKFKYIFKDDSGKKRSMMIEDWETGALFWRQLTKHKGDEAKAVGDVRWRYLNDFARTKDLFFFLGTTLSNHNRARNPFIIIGTFTPKIELQSELF